MRWFRNSVIAALLALGCVFVPGCSTVPAKANRADFLDRARSTTAWFESNVDGLSEQIEEAAGYIIFPDVAQWGLGLGGGTFGRGVLCSADGKQIGWAAINIASLGLQVGVQGFRMLMVIEDQNTLRKFRANQLGGSVTGMAVGGEIGGSTSRRFQKGVALYQNANSGLIAGVNVGLNFTRYEGLGKDEVGADLRPGSEVAAEEAPESPIASAM